MSQIRAVFGPFVTLYPRVFALMWQANGWRLIAAVILALVSALSMPIQIWISAVVINETVAIIQGGVSGASLASVLAPLTGFILIWVISQAATSLNEGLNEIMGDRTLYAATAACIDKACQFDLAFFDSGRQRGRFEIARDQTWRIHNVARQLLMILSQFVAAFALLGLMLSVSIVIPVVLCVAVLPRVFVRGAYARRMHHKIFGSIESQMLASHVEWLLTAADAAKDVRLFSLSDTLKQRFRDLKAVHLAINQEIVTSRERAMLLASVASIAGTVVAWGIAAAQALAGVISIGALAAVFQSVQQFGRTVDALFDLLGYLFANNPFLADLFAFLDVDVAGIDGALARPATGATVARVPQPIAQGLRLEHVTFKYPESEDVALDDVSLELRAGESVAIVGENGAGKSTLAKLIARLYDPTSGAVLLDGVDLRCYDKGDYHRHVSAVFQDFLHIHLSVREVVGFGDVSRLSDDARILQAIELGGARPVLEDLPHGLGTMLGKSIERGVELSGGQWQRLALARAFMRDAQVLILDEPSAALDPLAERDIYQRFAQLTAGKTTVLISHRLASCKMAHRILVLEGGKIIEQGTHDALMAHGSRYAEMFNAQAEHYARG